MGRGFVSAVLAEPAAGIEEARPRLVEAARVVLRPVLESRYISRRIREARFSCSRWRLLLPFVAFLFEHISCRMYALPQRFLPLVWRQRSYLATRYKLSILSTALCMASTYSMYVHCDENRVCW